MDKDYYKLYYKVEREHWWFKVRLNIIEDNIRALNLASDCKILNVGAATYKTSEMLKTIGHVESLEYDKDCCEFVSNYLKQPITQGSATELPYDDDTFNLVCAFDVIEHIEDHQLAMDEIRRVCKGFIFITVPAFNSLWSNHDVINHHFRRYKKSTLTELTKEYKDIELKRLTYFNALLFLPIAILRLASNLVKNRKAESDFKYFDSNSLLNKLFGMIFQIERKLLKLINFPVGVSLLMLLKYSENNKGE